MNIQGVVRQLSLFEPPIDPALLVKAAAAGVDISSALADLSVPAPPVPLPHSAQKAQQLCGESRLWATNCWQLWKSRTVKRSRSCDPPTNLRY